MAISKAFFGLRKKSTKSHTYQVYRGNQVTKDRVTEVANPQTDAQMSQRVLLPMVSNARAKLQGIINHSFEGVPYGYKSIEHFMRVNLRKGALTVVKKGFVPKGISDCGAANFIVSKGSLAGLSYNAGAATATGNTHFQLNCWGEESIWGSWTARPIWKEGNLTIEQLNDLGTAIFGTNTVPDQLTFLMGKQQYTGWSIDTDEDFMSGALHEFCASRLVFDPSRFEENANWKVKMKKVGDNNDLLIYDKNMALCLASNIKPKLFVIGSDWSAYEDPTDAEPFCMGATICSTFLNNVWRRSTQQLWAQEPGDEIEYSKAHATYMKASATTTKYLNTGSSSAGVI